MVRNVLLMLLLIWRNGKEGYYWYVINMKKWLRWAIIAIIVRTADQAKTSNLMEIQGHTRKREWKVKGQRLLRIKDFEKNIVVF